MVINAKQKYLDIQISSNCRLYIFCNIAHTETVITLALQLNDYSIYHYHMFGSIKFNCQFINISESSNCVSYFMSKVSSIIDNYVAVSHEPLMEFSVIAQHCLHLAVTERSNPMYEISMLEAPKLSLTSKRKVFLVVWSCPPIKHKIRHISFGTLRSTYKAMLELQAIQLR